MAHDFKAMTSKRLRKKIILKRLGKREDIVEKEETNLKLG
jgi:hypothetical protein